MHLLPWILLIILAALVGFVLRKTRTMEKARKRRFFIWYFSLDGIVLLGCAAIVFFVSDSKLAWIGLALSAAVAQITLLGIVVTQVIVQDRSALGGK